jgi:hypothetical protein
MVGGSTQHLVEAKGFAFGPTAPYNVFMLSNSRFNPAPGLADFWTEIRRPNPYRWPFLALSVLPVAAILYWALGTTVYAEPERPKVTYITTLDPARTDVEIAAENLTNQETKDLRAAEIARIAERKREMYKALGSAAGMDVEKIEAEAEAERAAEAAAAAKRREEMLAGAAEPARKAAEKGPGQ